jgi:GNAT superfamily N-acetyltransferase
MQLTADFLPGQLILERGVAADYRRLAHFHYAPGPPATWAGVWRAVYRDSESRHARTRVIGVAVLSYPSPSLRTRERTLNLTGPRYGPRLAFINRHIRTISRVIVHPQFRGIGIATALVHRICNECPTRYVEAIAVMGNLHPFFERAGMRRIAALSESESAYFIFDREGGRDAT